MDRRLLVLLLLGGLALRLQAEGSTQDSCLAFTEDVVSTDALDANKDARVWADARLGKEWRAATALDVAVHFDPERHDPGVRFCLAGSPYLWRLTPLAGDGGNGQLYVLGPEPPPPPGGVWPTAAIAAIRDDAPIAFTRGRIRPNVTDQRKDELVQGEFGSAYQSASLARAEEALRRVLPPGTEKFAIRGNAGSYSARLVGGRVSIDASSVQGLDHAPDGVPVIGERR